MGRGSQTIQAAALSLGVHAVSPQLPAGRQIGDALGLLAKVQETKEYEEICRRRRADEITEEQFDEEVGRLVQKLGEQ